MELIGNLYNSPGSEGGRREPSSLAEHSQELEQIKVSDAGSMV